MRRELKQDVFGDALESSDESAVYDVAMQMYGANAFAPIVYRSQEFISGTLHRVSPIK
jgi:hypothetical protein